ncbi:MAG: hypothetical protein JWP88_34 [Flaviaesturariibacter sp.]|nr:hypothetical protein [Flaviaesturariibacter sp.]
MLLALLLACRLQSQKEALPFYNTPDFTPQWLTPDDDAYDSIHTIAPFSFVNQDGNTITNESVKGKVYVASFFFTRCGSICPKMNANLKAVADSFAGNPAVLLLSHSVTPDIDSVPRLAHYAAQHRINASNWWLLTGNQDAIYSLARRSYFADEATGYNKGNDEFLHTENAVLVDQKGRIRGVYNATLALEMEKLVKHIHLLLEEY